MNRTDEYDSDKNICSNNHENEITKDDSFNLKSFIKNVLLAVDIVFILRFLSSGNVTLKLIITALVALPIAFCVYVHSSLNKSGNRDLLLKSEKYISAVILSVIFALKIICYISYLIIMIFNRPVHSEDYGFSVLLATPIISALYVDMFAYPFLYIYSEHKMAKLFVKAAVAFVILVLAVLGLLLIIGCIKTQSI